MVRASVAACTLFLLAAAHAQDVSKARRVALVIGNSAYSSLPKLPSVAKDADAIVEALENSGFKPEDVMRINNFTTADILTRVGEFEKRLKQGDVCLIYYAGHSVAHEGDNYLLPVDFDPKKQQVSEESAYLFARFPDRLDRYGLALKIYIVEGPDQVNLENTGVGLANPQIGSSKKTQETAFISAGGLGDTVRLSPDGVDVFTGIMARAIKEQRAELNEVLVKVGADVIAATKNSRQPQVPYYHSSADVTFFFHERPKEEPKEIIKTVEVTKPLAWPRTGVGVYNDKDHEEYIWIPNQIFKMGCVSTGPCEDAEKPQHEVTLNKGFWLGRNEVQVVSYKQYADQMKKPMPKGPIFDPKYKVTNNPMVDVRWEDANAYCTWAGGRLPTEAEWEAAARGGKTNEVYPFGDFNSSRDVANFDGKKGNDQFADIAPVRRFRANPYGLFDMSGNVWEWVNDWFGPYSAKPQDNPQGPDSGSEHVIRGGSFQSDPKIHLRLSYRKGSKSDDLNIGFRCAINSLPKPPDVQ